MAEINLARARNQKRRDRGDATPGTVTLFYAGIQSKAVTDGGPDFLVPGASRSGTTTLYHLLSAHEGLFLPDRKELHFFDRATNYERGLGDYESRFAPAGERPAGEVTPSYFPRGVVYRNGDHDSYEWRPDDDAPARIRRAYPDVKLVVTLRNPVTRAHSQFRKNYRQGRERADSFAEAVREELAGERPKETNPRCWVYRNRYPVHVGRWLDLFDRDQVRFLVFERWTDRPERALDEVCEFLGVEPRGAWPETDRKRNAGGTPRVVAGNRLYQDYLAHTAVARVLRRFRVPHVADALNSSPGYPDLSDEARELLAAEFGPEIDELESMIDRDLDPWRERLRG